jgi:hypothetical protein
VRETTSFPKPNRLADDFVNRGVVSQQPPSDPPPAPPRVLPSERTEATKTTISYRHKLENKKKLTWLAERLRRPVGELLDEALEARFPEWRAQAAARSDIDPFTR